MQTLGVGGPREHEPNGFWCPARGGIYRVCGLAVTAGIAVKFGTAHGRSRPAVGSVKCIGSYGRKGVPPAPCIFGTSQQKMITPTELLRPIYNFYSLTICS